MRHVTLAPRRIRSLRDRRATKLGPPAPRMLRLLASNRGTGGNSGRVGASTRAWSLAAALSPQKAKSGSGDEGKQIRLINLKKRKKERVTFYYHY